MCFCGWEREREREGARGKQVTRKGVVRVIYIFFLEGVGENYHIVRRFPNVTHSSFWWVACSSCREYLKIQLTHRRPTIPITETNIFFTFGEIKSFVVRTVR